jgi:hypothetical protein
MKPSTDYPVRIKKLIKDLSANEDHYEEVHGKYRELLSEMFTGVQEEESILKSVLLNYSVLNCCKSAAIISKDDNRLVESVGKSEHLKILTENVPKENTGFYDTSIELGKGLTGILSTYSFAFDKIRYTVASLSSSKLYDNSRFISTAYYIESLVTGILSLNHQSSFRPVKENIFVFQQYAQKVLKSDGTLYLRTLLFDTVNDLFGFIGTRKILNIYNAVLYQIRINYEEAKIFPVTGRSYIVTCTDVNLFEQYKGRYDYFYRNIVLTYESHESRIDSSKSLMDYLEDVTGHLKHL